jgi:single-stranded-DNA-specific exonuclease
VKIGLGVLIFLLRPPGLNPSSIGYNLYVQSTTRNEPMSDLPNTTPISRRWRVQLKIPRHVDVALREFSPFMRQLLYNRGLVDPVAAAGFVAGTAHFPTDPFLLKDMHLAVERLHMAIEGGERIAVYGDYDADGVTATALMAEFLAGLGVEPRVYIPNRYDEGYGLNDDALQVLAAEGIDLVITVDCGARSLSEAALASELGMTLIITDHHAPGAELPVAAALINPKQPGDTYPDQHLAGVGLAYKLAQAYLQTYPQPGVDPAEWLDLVAIGTVADLAPLTGENRTLVKAGLERIRRGHRQGLFALGQVAGLNLGACDSSMIGFGLGPRLNAAGRIDTAMNAFELLTATDFQRAGELAQILDSQNSQRQEETHLIREMAAARVLEQDADALLFFAADPEFSPGVVGLAASRLAEAYYRPAIVAHRGEEFTVGSCRSIPEFHITYALDECAELLVRHGGHAAAAGFTVRNELVPALVQQLMAIAARELADVTLIPVIDIDREIRLEKLNAGFIAGIFNDLHLLEPTGRGNPEPVFASYNVAVRHARTVGMDGKHLKLTLQAGGSIYDAIAFQQGHWLADLPDRIDIAYRLEENSYMGRVNLQLNVKDIRVAE